MFVSCGGREGISRASRLIVEVLTPSTEKGDRARKLDFYKGFSTIEAILFVWQDKQRVELQERTTDWWLVRNVIGGRAIAVAYLSLEISLDEIYA